MSLVVYVFGHVLGSWNFNFDFGRVLGAKINNHGHDQLSPCGATADGRATWTTATATTTTTTGVQRDAGTIRERAAVRKPAHDVIWRGNE
jgi:hypothetical protein